MIEEQGDNNKVDELLKDQGFPLANLNHKKGPKDQVNDPVNYKLERGL